MQIQVVPEFQGRGIGDRLLRQVLAEADEEGVRVMLDVLAKRLYEHVGFHEVKREELFFMMEREPVGAFPAVRPEAKRKTDFRFSGNEKV